MPDSIRNSWNPSSSLSLGGAAQADEAGPARTRSASSDQPGRNIGNEQHVKRLLRPGGKQGG